MSRGEQNQEPENRHFTPEEREEYIAGLQKKPISSRMPPKAYWYIVLAAACFFVLGGIIGTMSMEDDKAASYGRGYSAGYVAGSKTSASTSSSPTSTPTTAPTPVPTSKPVPTFSTITIRGSGDKTSEPFRVTTDEWRMTWSYEAESPEYAFFNIFIYPRGDTVSYVESVSSGAVDSGSTYSYAGAGEYYAVVLAANLISWEIQIKPA